MEANPTGETNSPHRGRVLTPASSRKDREHLYIAGRVLAICFSRGDPALTKTFPDTLPVVREIADALKSWVMVFLTLGFVLLYGLALIGKLKPLADASMVSRLEPIIFVIIGYYFGRLPAQQNERTLKDEIGRQTQKADAAQHAKEQALQSREAAEEKLKNINAALSSSGGIAKIYTSGERQLKEVECADAALRHSVAATLNILKSS
jgi:hypothetical protein